MSWIDEQIQETLRVGNYSGEIAQVYSILELEKAAKKALPILSRVAVDIDHMPTQPGIWREQLGYWMLERPTESQNRSGGTYITAIRPHQKLSFWQPHEMHRESMAPSIGLDYIENPDSSDEYGIHFTLMDDSPPFHRRFAPTHEIVHDLAVRRATTMLNEVAAEVGSTTPLEVFL